MDTSSRESNGIQAIRNFIHANPKIRLEATENDKIPTWDGNIFLYNSNDRKKNDLFGQARIQVKSTQREFRKTESVQIDRSDLGNL